MRVQVVKLMRSAAQFSSLPAMIFFVSHSRMSSSRSVDLVFCTMCMVSDAVVEASGGGWSGGGGGGVEGEGS